MLEHSRSSNGPVAVPSSTPLGHATAGGVLFIASTDDNRFRALDSKTGKELWVTKLDRRGNANPLTYQGRDGKQYVAVVATDTLTVYALPSSRP